jgi:sugar/nucleoside kinase (ribokinase family)
MAKSVCYGAGLVALDVILNGSPDTPAYLTAGGSCGNVLAILAFLGMETIPVARLSNDKAAKEILKDFTIWNVKDDLVTRSSDGSTPVIIHRILKDKAGKPKHKFEFKDPDSGSWLPQYKPVLSSFVRELDFPKSPDVFFFDRASRGTIDLAEKCKKEGALIFFEPPSASDLRLFKQAVEISDVVKFSSDRITSYDDIFPIAERLIEIRTMGSEGLEFRSNKFRDPSRWERAKPIPIDETLVIDSAGAGDWCSAGVIKTLLSFGTTTLDTNKSQIIDALNVGQSYSAVNICFIGARGAMYHLDKNTFIKVVKSVAKHDFDLLEKVIEQSPKSSLKSHKNLAISSLYL